MIGRFITDALDALRGVGEPSAADRVWQRVWNRPLTAKDRRFIVAYIRGYKLGRLAGTASLLAFLWHLPVGASSDWLAPGLGTLVFAVAAPGLGASLWALVVSWENNFGGGDDDGFGGPTANGT